MLRVLVIISVDHDASESRDTHTSSPSKSKRGGRHRRKRISRNKNNAMYDSVHSQDNSEDFDGSNDSSGRIRSPRIRKKRMGKQRSAAYQMLHQRGDMALDLGDTDNKKSDRKSSKTSSPSGRKRMQPLNLQGRNSEQKSGQPRILGDRGTERIIVVQPR